MTLKGNVEEAKQPNNSKSDKKYACMHTGQRQLQTENGGSEWNEGE